MRGRSIFFWLLFIALASPGSSAANFESKRSESIAQLQRQFGKITDLHPILFIDRDWMDSQTGPRIDVMDVYAQREANLKLHPRTLDTLVDYLQADIAVALPIHDPATNQWVCVVYGHNPYSSAEEEAKRHLYWDQFKEHAPEYQQKKIQRMLPKEVFARLTDIHETFHCLDSHYMIKARTGQYESEILAHKAESFAEVGAILYMAQEGFKNLVETRVLFRIVGSFMVGRYTDLLGPNLFSNVNFGVVYSFYPALFATQTYIDQMPDKKLSLDEILKMAHQIVETHSLSGNQAHAMTHYQRHPEKLQKLIDDFRNDQNEKLRAKFLEIEQHRNHYAKVVEWAFSELLSDQPTH